MSASIIHGFSKLSKEEKIKVISSQLQMPGLENDLQLFWHPSKQAVFDSFAENTLSNYYLPFTIAPNFLINDRVYHVPMVIEESSVVAAASSAAAFWAKWGGFKAKVLSAIKTGQIHFLWTGTGADLINHFQIIEGILLQKVKPILINMEQRGGGLKKIKLQDATKQLPNYYRLHVEFDTIDSMGANFINSVLESMASSLQDYCNAHLPDKGSCEIIMSILSNYNPDCIVEISAEANLEAFNTLDKDGNGARFCERFITAVQIAGLDTYRAVTHNKGIMNGVDAVVLSTGNDFRAIEAGVHAFAARNGNYTSLSSASIENGVFQLSVQLPLALGTVGGLTRLHPMAKKSLEILGNPVAQQLMSIAAAAGIANHFSAIKALVTSGIQKGHMKMHLTNILNQLGAAESQKAKATAWFADKTITVAAVREFLKIES
jgi:hydroxymethylglutaryl-CoA reductase